MVIIFSALGYKIIRLHREDLEQATYEAGDRITETVKRSTRYGMLHNRSDESTQLLRKLHGLAIAGSEKILGVTELDLFIPIFTFVFGEAQVGGSAALMSAHRLRQEFYGLPAAKDLLLMRAEKEAIHELGHALGLAHCRDYACVMRFSNSVEEVDVKSSELCPACSDKLYAPHGSSLAA